MRISGRGEWTWVLLSAAQPGHWQTAPCPCVLWHSQHTCLPRGPQSSCRWNNSFVASISMCFCACAWMCGCAKHGPAWETCAGDLVSLPGLLRWQWNEWQWTWDKFTTLERRQSRAAQLPCVHNVCVSVIRMHSENIAVCAECRAAARSTHSDENVHACLP